ncbi:DUF5060 domain-containing protein [Cytophaga sp. FL35]|uniref:DUF5060 domain-containing protein n=1 Tax=Cytophaga sp. FL35 TaxID=1904456 RepID=UPI001CA39A2F|nr:DUF5060 domain-containing protein [Cytophaga sp. FL35]
MKNAILFIVLLTSIFSFATEKWDVFEVEFKGPVTTNPFTDVQLEAQFKHGNISYIVNGFYDGNETYKIRFMPEFEGEWTFKTQSNISSLDNQTGKFICTPATEGNRGPVVVRDTFHFAYSDGTPFYPLGTTAYAWAHQNDKLIEQTLNTLSEHSFNKIRMTVMPKYYGRYISNEPIHYPFEKSSDSTWNHKKFNLEFFRNIERRIGQLKELGIEADVILFHPYDKWGFSKGTVEENQLYLKYLIARISSYSNVWWSMANEYDLMNKSEEEWEVYFKSILKNDPHRHLKSIHNGKAWYNHSKPWITHLSVQTPYLEKTQQWRETYQKPVINDEFVYEGNVPYDWGNLTAEETVNRFWILYCRGAYASHGETYTHKENILWWSKGGKLYGKSPKRLTFLHQIMKEAPDVVHPIHTEWNKETYLYNGTDYYLHYYGNSQQASAILNLSEGKKYKLEVIDAWNMTVVPLGGHYSGKVEIPLPQRPYMAVRAKVIH